MNSGKPFDKYLSFKANFMLYHQHYQHLGFNTPQHAESVCGSAIQATEHITAVIHSDLWAIVINAKILYFLLE